MEKILKKRVIKESKHETRESILSVFWVSKPFDSCKLILNLRKLNEYMPYAHFKIKIWQNMTLKMHIIQLPS